MKTIAQEEQTLQLLKDLGHGLCRVAEAIKPYDVMPGRDASDGVVTSLTEACMGITSGLFAIAASIDGLARAVEEGVTVAKD